ncbi:MAG: nitroreductase family protein [Anaerolineales bacterium]|jgi:nitroreductase|nr:nitroreductase family protein [Anaerolineales bacterium]
MNIREIILKNRSFRRFHQDHPIDYETLVELIDLARHSASGANKQPLKFYISFKPETNDIIFPNLRWAGYLEDWPGPQEGERPSAYIVIIGDNLISDSFGVDHGIAAQSILLGATERGLGGCILGSVQRIKLQRELGLADHYQILLVIALGKPGEIVVIEPLGLDRDIKYYRDADGIHHVPKRSLDDLLIE